MRESLFSALLFAFDKVVRLESSCFNTGTVSLISKGSAAVISNGYDLPARWPLLGNLQADGDEMGSCYFTGILTFCTKV